MSSSGFQKTLHWNHVYWGRGPSPQHGDTPVPKAASHNTHLPGPRLDRGQSCFQRDAPEDLLGKTAAVDLSGLDSGGVQKAQRGMHFLMSVNVKSVEIFIYIYIHINTAIRILSELIWISVYIPGICIYVLLTHFLKQTHVSGWYNHVVDCREFEIASFLDLYSTLEI